MCSRPPAAGSHPPLLAVGRAFGTRPVIAFAELQKYAVRVPWDGEVGRRRNVLVTAVRASGRFRAANGRGVAAAHPARWMLGVAERPAMPPGARGRRTPSPPHRPLGSVAVRPSRAAIPRVHRRVPRAPRRPLGFAAAHPARPAAPPDPAAKSCGQRNRTGLHCVRMDAGRSAESHIALSSSGLARSGRFACRDTG